MTSNVQQYVPVKRIGTEISPKITGDNLAFDEIETPVVILHETTTPTPLVDHGKLYTKSDNNLYFQDGAGTEKTTAAVDNNYGEAYIYNSAVDTVIETANIPVGLYVGIVTGLVAGWTFHTGHTDAIQSYQSGTGGASYTRVNSTGHILANGEVITIRGSTVAGQNGIFTVSDSNIDYFDIDFAWDSDGGVSDWIHPANLTAGVDAAGRYSADWQMSTAPDGACNLLWMMNKNATQQTKSAAERKYPINDLGSCSSSCVLDIAAGDIIWLSVQSDATDNILNKHGEFNIRRL